MPECISKIADTGFQGLQYIFKNVFIPKKKPRGGELHQEEKAWNRLISSSRIGVEHAIGGMKRFGIASKIFRGRKGQDDSYTGLGGCLPTSSLLHFSNEQ